MTARKPAAHRAGKYDLDVQRRRAADLAWAVLKAAKVYFPDALHALRQSGTAAVDFEAWAAHHHIADLPALCDAASVLAQFWGQYPHQADRLAIAPVRPLLPDLVIPASLDRNDFLRRTGALYNATIPPVPPHRRLQRQLAMFVLRRMKDAPVEDIVAELDPTGRLDDSTIRKAEQRIADQLRTPLALRK